MYDRILIAVDGSDEAKRAATHGLVLAQLLDATVDVVYVLERKSLRLTRTDGEKTRLRERSEAVLAEIEDVASSVGQPVSTAVVDGVPATEITAYAAEHDAELIVVGRQGATGLGKRLLGGVTERLLHRGDVPVLVVPRDAPTTQSAIDVSDVLLPTDGSDAADRATNHTVAIARQTRATVHVLHVVDLQSAGGAFSAGGLRTEFIERLETAGTETVDGVATTIADAEPELPVTTEVLRQTSFAGVSGGIHEYVGANDIDLVVVGSHGRSNLGRQLLGSVTSQLVRLVDVPVLVVNRD